MTEPFVGVTTYTVTPWDPVLPDAETADLITWVPAASVAQPERSLTEWAAPHPKLVVHPGKTGFEAAAVRLREISFPQTDGSQLEEALLEPRTMNLPVGIEADSPSQLRMFLRQLRREFNPLAGDGMLRVRTPDGDLRQITCRCVQGFEGNESPESSGPSWLDLVLSFRAPDPYWYGTSMIPTPFAPLGTPGSMFPFPPLALSAGINNPNSIINVAGDTLTWPVWVVHGPSNGVTIEATAIDPRTSLLRTQTITISQILNNTDIITIDTRPRAKTVTKQDGTNFWPYITADSALFPLYAGLNTLNIVLNAATVESYVIVQYIPRYLGL